MLPRLRRFSRLSSILASAGVAAATLGIAGCGLFHRGETPQEQFTEALERGNSTQASYIWNNMSTQDREKFERGEGLSPKTDPSAIAAQIEQHQEEQTPATVEIPGD